MKDIFHIGKRNSRQIFLLAALVSSFALTADVPLSARQVAGSPYTYIDGYKIFGDLSSDKARALGMERAKKDIKRNKFTIYIYGLRRAISPSDKYLKERYNIEHVAIAGCIVSESIVEGARGYNDTMKKHLLAHFGKDVFAEAEQAVKKQVKKSTG